MRISIKEKPLTEEQRGWARRYAAATAAREGKLKITPEEKERWAPFLHDIWNAIGPDAEPLISKGRSRKAEIIEMCLDANRPTSFSDMTPEEEGVLCGLWIKPDRETLRWLREELNY
jgi:hypothetical protein